MANFVEISLVVGLFNFCWGMGNFMALKHVESETLLGTRDNCLVKVCGGEGENVI
jgi:hypothetical protein